MSSLKIYLLRWLRPLVFVVILLNLFKTVPATAASFDGTYNYSYNLKGPSGWETHSVNSGFIVINSVISSNPAALSGSVSSSGAVQFTGPCPMEIQQPLSQAQLTIVGREAELTVAHIVILGAGPSPASLVVATRLLTRFSSSSLVLEDCSPSLVMSLLTPQWA